MAERPTPIFVVGLQRSGTTWVANCLGGHPDIAVIEAEDHHGIHESIFFSHFARAYGDLADDAAYARFLEGFLTCDYFLLSGVDAQEFTAVRHRTYAEAFSYLMDRVARDRGCRFWLEKSPDHTPFVADIRRAFPAARFVCVVRDPRGLVRSRLHAYGRRPARGLKRMAQVVKGGVAVSFYQRLLADFCRKDDLALLVRYDDLVAGTEQGLQAITGFIGCGFDEGVLQERFSPNTSFSGPGKSARPGLGEVDRFLLALALGLTGLVPLALLRRIQAWKAGRTGVRWPDWCWKRRDGFTPDRERSR
ncbi:MAG: sulfotransferase [Candidatus Krumholzibacteriia bacterium]